MVDGLSQQFAICGANQWTGFYMISASVMKGLIRKHQLVIPAIMLFVFYFKVTLKYNATSYHNTMLLLNLFKV